MKRVFKHFLLAFALVFTFVLFSSDSVQAAPKPIRTFSDAPVKYSNSKGAFHGKFTQTYGKTYRLQGWVAADAPISDFTYEFDYASGHHVFGNINSVSRPDVKKAYPNYKYCLGFEYPDINILLGGYSFGMNGTFCIYAMIGGTKTLVGQYDISSKDMKTCSDFPITIAPHDGPFYGNVYMTQSTQLNLQGWVASNVAISNIYAEFKYPIYGTRALSCYNLPLEVGTRYDVKAAYPSYAYCIGFRMNPIYSDVIKRYLSNTYGYGYIEIYATINGQKRFIGEYMLSMK